MGGITDVRRVADLARVFGLPFIPHYLAGVRALFGFTPCSNNVQYIVAGTSFPNPLRGELLTEPLSVVVLTIETVAEALTLAEPAGVDAGFASGFMANIWVSRLRLLMQFNFPLPHSALALMHMANLIQKGYGGARSCSPGTRC